MEVAEAAGGDPVMCSFHRLLEFVAGPRDGPREDLVAEDLLEFRKRICVPSKRRGRSQLML